MSQTAVHTQKVQYFRIYRLHWAVLSTCSHTLNYQEKTNWAEWIHICLNPEINDLISFNIRAAEFVHISTKWVNENTGSWADIAWTALQVCRAEQHEIKTDVTKIFHKKESSLLSGIYSTDVQDKMRVREEKELIPNVCNSKYGLKNIKNSVAAWKTSSQWLQVKHQWTRLSWVSCSTWNVTVSSPSKLFLITEVKMKQLSGSSLFKVPSRINPTDKSL